MKLITLQQAREHCKADSDDDAMLTLYVNGAEKACAHAAARNLYKDQAEMDAAVATVAASMATARTARDTALAAITAPAGTEEGDLLRSIAYRNYQQVVETTSDIMHGIVADDDVIAAVLLTVGHLYRNREEVITGQGAAAVELPQGAAAIMYRHRYVGLL